ncbi:uroporphyrinogen decarboxylase family protein [Candidatus Bipolaricaulota bacterium]|nr:uroporphyrinogen decarboxylase family protein [Candidatus Bipolaricaulota bacterium]
MIGKMLVEEAINGVETEVPPTGVHSVWPAAEQSRYSIGECCKYGDKMAEAQIDFQNRHPMDVIHLEIGVGPLVEAMGAKVSWADDRPPVVRENPIESLEDIDRLELPDPYRDGKLPELLKATESVSRELDDDAFIIAEADQGPFNLAAQIIGIEKLLRKISLREDLELIESLFSFTTEAVFRLGRAQIDSGGDATCVGESYVSPDMISPDTYRDFVMGTHRELATRFGREGIRWALHICGDITDILGHLDSVNPAILEVDYKTDLSAIGQEISESVVLGTVDPRTFVGRGEKSLEEEVRENMKLLKPGGRFILHSGCTLPTDTSDEIIDRFLSLTNS